MKPRRIFLIRHGQSEGNIDVHIYNKKPDFSIRLTDKGKDEIRLSGEKLSRLIKGQTVGFISSPF